MQRQPRLIIHGGAWSIPDKFVAAHLRGIQLALGKVYPALKSGIHAVDAVTMAVALLEDDPTYDAGRGSFLNCTGEIEMDAIVMDGADLRVGAVAGIRNVQNPVLVAKALLGNPEHCVLVGSGAHLWAMENGFSFTATEKLIAEREREFFKKIRHDRSFHTYTPFTEGPLGTVGAVAMDLNGNLAAATSTGGTPRKIPGRVGDTPLPGAGAYADRQLGAASSTGWGESILRVLLAKTTCDHFADHPASAVGAKAIKILEERVNGKGGVIGISPAGDYTFAHNTFRMAFGYVENDEHLTFIEFP